MAIDYQVDLERGVLIARAVGPVSDEDFIDFAERAAGDDEARSGVHELIDLSEADIGAISTNAVRQAVQIFAAGDREPSNARVAIVAPSSLAYGISRMYQSLRGDSHPEIRVFRETGEAREWLGLPEAD